MMLAVLEQLKPEAQNAQFFLLFQQNHCHKTGIVSSELRLLFLLRLPGITTV